MHVLRKTHRNNNFLIVDPNLRVSIKFIIKYKKGLLKEALEKGIQRLATEVIEHDVFSLNA